MHHDNFTFSLNQICKIEGHATLDVAVSQGNVTQCRFAITDFKRFYTKAVEKKPAAAAPQLLSRICGTCSNAHIMASLKAIEQALAIEITSDTQRRRELVNAGMYIRDHALHLIVFVLPDVYVVDNKGNAEILLNTLNTKRYFEQIKLEDKKISDIILQKMIRNI